MKNVFIAAALCALPTLAFSADLPSHKAPPVYAPPPPVFTWTGYYVGATAGYAFNTDHNFSNYGTTGPAAAGIVAGDTPAFVRNRTDGFTGGGEFGYNYEFANTSYFGTGGGVVIGFEADAMYVGPGETTLFQATNTNFFHSRTDFVGTARGRLGYAFGNFLIYGTGGFAYGGVHDHVTIFTPAGNILNGDRSSIKTGYAFGGGVAYAIPTTSFLNFFHSSAVTLKVEYIHYDLGGSDIPVINLTGMVPIGTHIATEGNLVRAGLDYKFDFFSPSSPVVAKY